MSDCCTPDGGCSTATTPDGGRATAVAEARTAVYDVAGMTCGHCRTALTGAIGALDGVLGVDVDLDAGRVTVRTSGEPDEAAVARAVDDAGYELTGRAA